MAGSTARDTNEAARRYAGALLELAHEKGELSTIHKDFKGFLELVAGSAELKRLLASPAYGRDEKVKALSEIAKKSGTSALFGKFLGTMAANGRAADIPATGREFEALYAKQRGVQRVIVSTASPMSADQQKRIEALVAKSVGGEVELSTEVDPALVGGIQLRIGSKLVDASLAAKLNRMNLAMKGA